MSGPILLYSAGLDSHPAWYALGRPPALHLDIRHHFRDQELACVRDLADRAGIDLEISSELDLSRYDNDQADIIPLRNMYFAMLAAQRGADVIWCVGVKGDHTRDKSPEAFAAMGEFLSRFADRPIRVDSPFWDKTKSEIVAWYLAERHPVDELLATFSCLTPGTSFEHCGRCPSCLRRWIALANNGLDGSFAAPPWRWERVESYYLAAMRDGIYPPDRVAEFAAAMATVGVTV